MCEFHNSNSNGLGDMWWTDKCIYFSSIDGPASAVSWPRSLLSAVGPPTTAT